METAGLGRLHVDAFVCKSCRSEVPQGGRLFSHILVAGSPRLGCRHSWFLLGPLSLPGRRPSPGCVLVWSLLCDMVSLGSLCIIISSPYKDSSHAKLTPTLTTSLELNLLLEKPYLKIQSLPEVQGVRLYSTNFTGM